MKVLGIETSADDTGIALIEAEGDFGPDFRCTVLANEVSSQKVHAEYGGIYPNLAKREHAKNLPLLLEKISKATDAAEIDAIAVTVGPGLEPCLWQGITFAQELAKKWKVSLVPVNHMEGHIVMSTTSLSELATASPLNMILQSKVITMASFEFPTVVLLISGGHTDLILMKKFGAYEYLGRTRDDAVGEAFDKVARMLGLPYPGGPHISRLAEEARNMNQESGVKLPRPMLNEDNLDFSFSGLKTAVLRYIEKWQGKTLPFEVKQRLAREFEDAVADVLAYKTFRAVEEHGAQTLILGGGVSANARIRKKFTFWTKETGRKLLVCPPELSTDNGLMIALAGYFRTLQKNFAEADQLKASGTLRLGEKNEH